MQTERPSEESFEPSNGRGNRRLSTQTNRPLEKNVRTHTSATKQTGCSCILWLLYATILFLEAKDEERPTVISALVPD